MQKQGKLILTTALVGSALIGMGVFAANITGTANMTGWNQNSLSMGKHSGMGNQGKGMMGRNVVSQFIKSDLTDEQKTALEALQKTHLEETKALMDEFKAIENPTDEQKQEFEAKLEALRVEHLGEMKVYVDEDKIEEFEKFVSEKPQNMGMGRGMKGMSFTGMNCSESCSMGQGMGKHSGMGNQGKGMMGRNVIGQFIKSDLTDEQKTALEALQKTHLEETKALMDEFKAIENPTDEQKQEFEAKLEALRVEHLGEMKVYVDEDKIEEFEKFVSEKPQNMGMGKGMRGEGIDKGRGNGDMKGMNQKRGYIKGATLIKVQGILSGLSQEKLNTLLTKLDTLIANLGDDADEKKVGLYNELRDLVKQALEGDSNEDELLNIINS